MFKYIFPFFAAILTFLIGGFVAGNFEWQTWDPFGKIILIWFWLAVGMFPMGMSYLDGK